MLILAILIYGVRTKEVLIFVFIELKTVKKEMLVRVARRLTLEEVREKIKNFETRYDMTFNGFEELF